MLDARQAFASFAQNFTAEGDTRVTQSATGRKLVRQNFVVDDQMVADFRQQLTADRVKIDEDGFKQDLEFIRAMIRFEIDTALFGVGDAWRHMMTGRSAGAGGPDRVRRKPRNFWS